MSATPEQSLSLSVSPLQEIAEHPGREAGVALFIKRDDLLHPEIDGSKGRKLAAVLPDIQANYPGGLVTFGGAFSNHLHAVAIAGRLCGIPTRGILRGEYPDLDNPTLRICRENGMELTPMARTLFDAMKQRKPADWEQRFPGAYYLPEGGNTPEALLACSAIARETEDQLPPDRKQSPLFFCAPAGTGCTAAGIAAGLEHPQSRLLIFPVSTHGLNHDTVQELLHRAGAPQIGDRFMFISDYVFGGFARLHTPVMSFIRDFYRETDILPDPVYTGKMLFGVYDLLQKGYFPEGSTVVALHSGGIQGWEGFEARYGLLGTVDAGRH